MVYKNGEYKVAQYGQWDGYPEALGASILNFLHNINLDMFRSRIDNVSFLNQEDFDEINKHIESAREIIPKYEWQKMYPELSRDTGGDILSMIMFKDKTKLKNSIEFAADSVFCEWAYVIDLDKNVFEVYRGFNEKPLNENERFYFLEEKAKGKYHPVVFVKSYKLDELPDEKIFISDFTDEE